MIRPYKRMLVTAFTAGLLAVLAGLIPVTAATPGAAAPVNFSVTNGPLPPCPDGEAYVNHAATGTNTGVSWANAFTDLQSALKSTCTSFSEIWVAKGVYKPGSTLLDTFKVKLGVSLYGGFAGTEGNRDERDWVTNVTVLSGDVDNNDITDANGVVTTTTNIKFNNAYHVVWMDGTTFMDSLTRLDGFVITAGKGSGGDIPDGIGGGVYCDGYQGTCSPTIANVIFSGNQSGRGGGMYNDGEGGTANPSFTNVTFTGNAATVDGGGLYNGGPSLGSSNPTLTNVTFAGNQAAGAGGAMVNQGSPTGESSPILTNVVFSNNSAGAEGGALYNNAGNRGTSRPRLTNVTFYSNTSATRGGAIYSISTNLGDGMVSLINAILWGNTATQGDAQIGNNDTTTIVLFSVVQGGWAGGGSFNLTADPLFADAANCNLNLLPGSPAIDSGSASGTPLTDIRDLPRPVNAEWDMGAYEVRGFDLAITAGNPQTTTPGTAFGTPLSVQVTSSYTEQVGAGGVLTFTPPASGAGLNISIPFTVATDAGGLVSPTVTANNVAGSYQVTVTARGVVTPVVFTLTNGQPPPLAVNDAAGTLQDTPVTVSVLANDLDLAGGGLTVSAIKLTPAHGTAVRTGDSQAVLYTPEAGFAGQDSFTYVAEDTNGNSDDALATVVVAPKSQVGEPPQVTPVDPQVAITTPFTSANADVEVQLPEGFFAETLEEKDILFLSYTPVVTPTEATTTPPGNLKFGNFEFNLSLFLNNEPQHGVQFAVPITVTINYNASIMDGLKEETLEVYYWNEGDWSTAGITIVNRDTTNHTITIALSHLSQFGFFAQKTPTGLAPGDEPQLERRLFLPGVMR